MKKLVSRAHPAVRRAFTLMEVLIALTIFGFVMMGALGIYRYSIHTLAIDMGRTMVNKDFRTFVSEMSSSCSFSNRIILYSQFNNRTKVLDANLNYSGNFVVFVFESPYKEDGTVRSDGKNYYTKIIGYYRGDPDSKGRTPIRRFTIIPTNVLASTDVLTLLPATSTMNSASHSIEFPDCEGLHPGSNVFLDMKNNGSGVVVYAQLRNPGNLAKKAMNSINFTIARRS